MAGIEQQAIAALVEMGEMRVLAGGADLRYPLQPCIEHQVRAALLAHGDPLAIGRHRAMLHAQADAQVLGGDAIGQLLLQVFQARQQARGALGLQDEDAVGAHQQYPAPVGEGNQAAGARAPGVFKRHPPPAGSRGDRARQNLPPLARSSRR